MNSEEYARMHALETNYWWFVGRRAIIASLLEAARPQLLQARQAQAPHETEIGEQGGADALRLLDIGCGTGANLPMLHAFVGPAGALTGIDFSPLALEFARSHPESKNADLQQADALNLPFDDNSFDIVTMLDVLEHLSDDERALQEVRRVLRPGGVYVWSVPAYQKLWSAHDEALHHFRRYEYHGLRCLLRQQGFDIYRLSFAMSAMPPIAWAWRKLVLPFKPRRPRDARRHSEGAVLPSVTPFVNKALVRYLDAEGKILTRCRIRFGTSLVGIARKPLS
ncbi:MAG TPA: methyltransferase domain-containing protein [Abditibacteriaceae bacterium]|jgi:SAM-dependent methyltransferase